MPIFERATLRSEYFSPTLMRDGSRNLFSKTSAGEAAHATHTLQYERENKKDKSLVVNSVTCCYLGENVIRARQVPLGLPGIDRIAQRSTPERPTITHTAAHDAA